MQKKTQPNEIGRKLFQPNCISWSYLNLGSVARTQINENKKNRTLKEKIKAESKKMPKKEIVEPPKKRVVIKIQEAIIFRYSPIKKSAKVGPEYSTL